MVPKGGSGRVGMRSLVSIALLSAVFLSGCSALYIVQAAYEQGRILWRREPIELALKKPDLDPATREKFELVLAVRDFARNHVKLRVGGSYSTYSYVDRPTISYVLMAVPKTDLAPYTWWFPIVGRVPYKGFFSLEAAQAEAVRFKTRGYDTFVRTAPAYSTLGWFDDPLMLHLLKYDNVGLAQLIFHELLHNSVFVSGAVDFNESLANFVGHRAAILFFRDRLGEDSAEYKRAVQSWEEEREFSGFVAEVARALGEIYGKDLPSEEKLRRREDIFSWSKEEWARRIRGRPSHRYGTFSQLELNNAVVAHYLIYMRDLALFESLYEAHQRDLGRLVAWIKEAVADGGDPFDAVRARGVRVSQRPP